MVIDVRTDSTKDWVSANVTGGYAFVPMLTEIFHTRIVSFSDMLMTWHFSIESHEILLMAELFF